MVKSSTKVTNLERMERESVAKYEMHRKYGIDHEDAMKLANSQKGYWRVSRPKIEQPAITKEKLVK